MTEPSQTPATLARHLVRRAATAALAVRLPPDGHPYASLVLTALDHAGRPLLFISRLAEHTKALEADPAAALLFDDTAGLEARLTGARATLVGRAAKVDDAALKDRFVARHPEAAMYRDFPDFAVWRLEVERVHLVAGFGRIHWIDGADFLFPADEAAELAAAEPGIVAHMNADHADAVALYATVLAGRPADAWRMVAIDPDGIDLMAGPATRCRIAFPAPVRNATEARASLVDLVRVARQAAT
ncbi:HugZ family protein [Zavarzinia sp.]|uniref:HugZ family pyridoxamine 5'-phosphate oxidase n=1 Tax=Zavarzinia sp. TaxID=2027920 RepID=UPI003569BC62